MTDTSSPDSSIALSVRGVSKTYPGTRALDEVNIDVSFGEVHALCGGNGSGKSTLIKILCGVVSADQGIITIAGHEMPVGEVTAQNAHSLGIRVVHQDPPLFPDLSIAENMMLGGAYPRGRTGRIDWRRTRRSTVAQLARFQIEAEPETLIRDLPVAIRTQVAIATALQDVVDGEQSIIILDEPTAALPVGEVQLLLDTMRRLASMGHAIVFVSHRLDEVMAATHRVTVLRDGRVFRQHVTSELTENELIESILGRLADEIRTKRESVEPGDIVVSVRGLHAGPLRDVSMDAREGEVVGIAGLLGSGRTELLRAIYGDLRKSSGEISVKGRRTGFRHIGQALDAGVIMIPEDRSREAVFTDMSVNDNLDVGVLAKYWRGLGFRKAKMRSDADQLLSRFRVKTVNGEAAIRTLSGGNQQKVVLARWLRDDPSVLLLDEPTQGVDIGARSDIHALIRRSTNAGGAAIVVSSDFEEIAQFADRAIVLRRGRVIALVPQEDLSAHRLNQLVYGREENDENHDQ